MGTESRTTVGDTPGSPAGSVFWVLVYAAALVSPLAIAGILGETEGPFLYTLGKGFALVGTTILFLQLVLAARLHFFSNHYGLDMIMRFHKGMGIFGAVLILSHPILIAAGMGHWEIITSMNMPWYIWLGRIAWVGLLGIAIISPFQKQLLEFERWRFMHNFGVVVVLLAFVHSWMAGSDLQILAMKGLWIGLLVVALGAYAYHKLYVPAAADVWKVTDVTQETHDVYTLTFEPPEGTGFSHLPGQFRFLRLHRGGRYDGEEHPFTIASSPTLGATQTATIKESGDFTNTIGDTKIGDTAIIEGSFGRFSYLLYPEEDDLVFIAGGIGITPLMSMIRHMRDTNDERKVILLNANRTPRDIVFKEELDEIAQVTAPDLTVVNVMSEAGDEWGGEMGYVDSDLIMRYCGEDLSGKAFYVCGPPPMMDAVIGHLSDLGVPAARIHAERFAL